MRDTHADNPLKIMPASDQTAPSARKPRSTPAAAKPAAKPAAQAAALGSAAGMESRRPLCRDRRSGGQARPRSRRCRLPRVRARTSRASSPRSRTRPDAGRALAEAVKRYEALDDLLGRLDLLCRAASMPATPPIPARAKFYGDVQERITAASIASAVLRARTQPHRRRQARSRDGRSRARPLPALARGHPQGQALSARGSRRAAVPREVGDRLFGLEPAVRRDHRAACASRSAGKSLAIEPTLNLLQDPKREDAQGGGAGAGQDLQGEPARRSR